MSLLPITAFGILPERVATDVVGRISSVASFSVVASSVVVSVVASSVVLVVSSAANLSLLASSIRYPFMSFSDQNIPMICQTRDYKILIKL